MQVQPNTGQAPRTLWDSKHLQTTAGGPFVLLERPRRGLTRMGLCCLSTASELGVSGHSPPGTLNSPFSHHLSPSLF